MSDTTFWADSEAPIVNLSAKKHFDQLNQNAQLYAHHLSRASFAGNRVVSRSISPESEAIIDLILAVHKKLSSPKSNEEYIEKLKHENVDSSVVTAYLEYASQVLSNLGNYKSFGDKKFIPRMALDAVFGFDDDIKASWNKVKKAVYDTSASLLGWPEKGQLSSYYLGSIITQSEVDTVNRALSEAGVMPENTRVEKTDSKIIIHVASADLDNNTGYYPNNMRADGLEIEFKFGDHHSEFENIVCHLKEALKYTANDTQTKLISFYIESFKTGSMNAHKNSQIEWVKDLKPDVESNIGFIETYRDPSGVRGEWEGLVAMVNKDRTEKFSTLVNNATSLIGQLPWDSFYEKDKFNPPDFTSLEVLTFAGSGIPAGINIPNYDDVRLNYGFKNVSLGNVLSANPKNPKKEEVVSFLGPDLLPIYKKWRDDAFEIQVGLHELLGHGSGKLLQETDDGFNFDKESEIGSTTTYYKSTDSWGSLFGLTAGSYEECRAELVALYLMLKLPKQVLPIFGIKPADFQEIMLAGTIYMARAGLLALEFWDPSTEIWGQAHMRARFAITKCLTDAGVVSFEHKESDYSDLVLKIDESKLDVAITALGEFLNKLHVYKSTANVTDGVKFYVDMTTVNSLQKQFRSVVLAKKLPRKQIIQANTSLVDGKVHVQEYEECEASMIESYVDRY